MVSRSRKYGSKKSAPVNVSALVSKKRVIQNMMKGKIIPPQLIKINFKTIGFLSHTLGNVK